VCFCCDEIGFGKIGKLKMDMGTGIGSMDMHGIRLGLDGKEYWKWNLASGCLGIRWNISMGLEMRFSKRLFGSLTHGRKIGIWKQARIWIGM